MPIQGPGYTPWELLGGTEPDPPPKPPWWWKWLMKHWPRCKPYDTKKRLCLRHPGWNGRCPEHVRKAVALGEDP